MFLGYHVLIGVVEVQLQRYFRFSKTRVNFFGKRYNINAGQYVSAEFCEYLFLLMLKKDYTDRLELKIGNKKARMVIMQKVFAYFLFLLAQKDFQKYIRIDKIHYRHSIALC